MFLNKVNKSKVEKFWDWFVSNSEKLYINLQKDQQNQLSVIEEKLHLVNENLAFQLAGAGKDGRYEFIISADGIKDLIEPVLDLTEKAPKLDKWKITAFRQRADDFEEIDFGDFKILSSDIYFKDIDEGNKTGLVLFIKNFQNTKRFIGAVFILLDVKLGEYDVMTKIGSIDFRDLDEADIKLHKPLKELPKFIDSKKVLN